MFREYGGVAAVAGSALLGGAIVAGVTWPRPSALPTHQYEAPLDIQYRPGGAACDPNVLSFTLAPSEAATKRDACAKEIEEHRLSTNDLVQQTRAADAATAQAEVAAQALWMTFFQTIGGFLTLVAATAAAAYARSAAGEARRSADIAAGVYERQFAAYPHIGDASATVKFESLSFDVDIVNKGFLAITITQIRTVFYVICDGTFVSEKQEVIPFNLQVGPNDTHHQTARSDLPRWWETHNSLLVLLDYEATYNDGSGAEKVLRFPLKCSFDNHEQTVHLDWRDAHVEGRQSYDDRPLAELSLPSNGGSTNWGS